MNLTLSILKLPFEALYQLLSQSSGELGLRFRYWLAGKRGVQVGKQSKLGPRFMSFGQGISIGDQFSCYWDCRIVSEQSEIQIGKHVVFSHHVDIAAGPGGYIKIGDRTSIAQFVVIRNCAHRYTDITRPIQEQGHSTGIIEIGADCLLAASAIILPNTQLGDGCVVGSGSVVSGNFPAYSIIAGHPARIIGKRS